MENNFFNDIALLELEKPVALKEGIAIGKKHALKKYDQFALNTSCFLGSTGSNITSVVPFHEFFVIKIMKKGLKKIIYLFIYYCC